MSLDFFDFLLDMKPYSDDEITVARMNARHWHLIEPFTSQIKDARVFDIASHDGRWAYAFAGAGAKKVVGVEARQELIDRFQSFPDAGLRQKVDLRCNDLFAELDSEVAKGISYDVVSIFGILYHIMDHFRLLKTVHALRPKLVLIDSEFMDRPWPMVQLMREKTDKHLNAAPQIEGQEMAVVGYPSFKALEVMADVLGYDVEWLDWDMFPQESRRGIQDYYRSGDKQRASCVLTPRS